MKLERRTRSTVNMFRLEKRMKSVKPFISAILLIICFILLTGCARKDAAPYTVESVSLPTEDAVFRFVSSENAAYFMTASDISASMNVYRYDYSSGETVLVTTIPQSSTELEDGATHTVSLGPCGVSGDDRFCCCVNDLTMYEDSFSVNQVSLLLFSEDAKSYTEVDATSITKNAAEIISGVVPLSDGSVLIYTSKAVWRTDHDGTLHQLGEAESGSIRDLYCEDGDNVYGIWSKTSSEEVIFELDTENGEFAELGDLDNSNTYEIAGRNGQIVFLRSDSGLYSYDLSTGEYSRLIDWIEYGIAPRSLGDVTYINELGVLSLVYDQNYTEAEVLLLAEDTSGTTLDNKDQIVLAGVYIPDDVIRSVSAFNKANSGTNIVCQDYSSYDNESNGYTGGITRLKLDIMSGNTPDLIVLEGLSVEDYAEKGVLSELTSLMNEDNDFLNNCYQNNVLDSLRINGKLYSISPGYEIRTLVGKTSLVGQENSWSMEQLQQLVSEHPEAQLMEGLIRTDLLRRALSMCLGDYVDFDAGTCDFQTSDFADILEMIKPFSDEAAYFGAEPDDYYNEKVLLEELHVNSYSSVLLPLSEFGDDISIVGFPCRTGTGAFIYPTVEIGISADTEYSDECWQFLQYLLSEDVQKTLTNVLPLRKDVLLQRKTVEAEKGVIPYTLLEEIDYLVESTDTLYRNYSDCSEILDIICEEAGAYFTDDEPLESVVPKIQSRVSIYMAEKY